MAIKKTVKIIDNFDRKKLSEGRNFGLGFSILKKNANNVYESLLAFTACKDFLNDIVFVEKHQKPIGLVYGLNYEPTGTFKRKQYFYLGLKPLDFIKGRNYSRFKDINNLLINNNKNLLKVINNIEEIFGLKKKTTIEAVTEDTVLLKVPMFWARETYLISLYTLACRVYFHVNDEDLKMPPEDFYVKVKPFFKEDSILHLQIHKILDANLRKNLLKVDEPGLHRGIYCIHNYGYSAALQSLNS